MLGACPGPTEPSRGPQGNPSPSLWLWASVPGEAGLGLAQRAVRTGRLGLGQRGAVEEVGVRALQRSRLAACTSVVGGVCRWLWGPILHVCGTLGPPTLHAVNGAHSLRAWCFLCVWTCLLKGAASGGRVSCSARSPGTLGRGTPKDPGPARWRWVEQWASFRWAPSTAPEVTPRGALRCEHKSCDLGPAGGACWEGSSLVPSCPKLAYCSAGQNDLLIRPLDFWSYV